MFVTSGRFYHLKVYHLGWSLPLIFLLKCFGNMAILDLICDASHLENDTCVSSRQLTGVESANACSRASFLVADFKSYPTCYHASAHRHTKLCETYGLVLRRAVVMRHVQMGVHFSFCSLHTSSIFSMKYGACDVGLEIRGWYCWESRACIWPARKS
jgi:hypothetical protein